MWNLFSISEIWAFIFTSDVWFLGIKNSVTKTTALVLEKPGDNYTHPLSPEIGELSEYYNTFLKITLKSLNSPLSQCHLDDLLYSTRPAELVWKLPHSAYISQKGSIFC